MFILVLNCIHGTIEGKTHIITYQLKRVYVFLQKRVIALR